MAGLQLRRSAQHLLGEECESAGEIATRLATTLEHCALEEPAVIAHDIGGAGSRFYQLVWEHSTVFEQLPMPIHDGVLRAYVGTAQPRPTSGNTAGLDELTTRGEHDDQYPA
jgi:hypothetical protein